MVHLKKKKEKCEVRPIHCWGSASATEASGTIYENNINASKATCCAFCLMSSWAKNTQNRLSRKVLMRFFEVFTVVQYGDQMCIMNVHNHEWGDYFSSCFIHFWWLLGPFYFSLQNGKCRNLTVLFQWVLWIMKVSLHIHVIVVPGVPYIHNFNILSKSDQKEVPQSSFHLCFILLICSCSIL